MNKSIILTEIKNRTGVIWLNRADKRNALNPSLVVALTDVFRLFIKDPSVKIILLRGKGDAFCAGADLAVLKQLKKASNDQNLSDSKQLATLFDTIYSCPKPVIAAVHGHAIAGGCGLASVCDFIISSEHAKFGYTEVRIGFVPAIVAQFLIRKVGGAQARKLLLTGSLISAKEAQEIGLVTQCVSAEEFEDTIERLIETLVHKSSGEALQATKSLINVVTDASYSEAMDYAVTLNAKARTTKDCQRGIQAFLDKKPIEW